MAKVVSKKDIELAITNQIKGQSRIDMLMKLYDLLCENDEEVKRELNSSNNNSKSKKV